MSGKQSAAMDRALYLVMVEGKSQKQARDRTGVSMSGLQRALRRQGIDGKAGNPNWVRKVDSENQSTIKQDAL